MPTPKTPPADTFAARLRTLREQAGYSQGELAVLCDWSAARISSLERTSYRPRRETVVTLAGALGVQPSALDPGWTVEVPAGAVVLRPDPLVERRYRPWRDEDRAHVGESIDCDQLPALTTLLKAHGLGLYLLP